jgi:hypothetical protein
VFFAVNGIGLRGGISTIMHQDRYTAAADAIMEHGDEDWSQPTKTLVTGFYHHFDAATVRFFATASGVDFTGCTTKDQVIARLVADKAIPVTWTALDVYSELYKQWQVAPDQPPLAPVQPPVAAAPAIVLLDVPAGVPQAAPVAAPAPIQAPVALVPPAAAAFPVVQQPAVPSFGDLAPCS